MLMFWTEKCNQEHRSHLLDVSLMMIATNFESVISGFFTGFDFKLRKKFVCYIFLTVY